MKRTPFAALLLIAGAALAAAGFLAGRHGVHDAGVPQAAGAPAAGPAPQGERKVLYWHDPMVPGPRFDKPGKSPFMDMQLVPVHADDAAQGGGVTISPGVQQNLGIRVETVRRATVSSSFDAVGSVQFDERQSVAVQTRVAGYVERLSVRAPMERVRRGQPLATIFAPDWLGPLNELAALRQAGVSADLLDAARDRCRALSIPPELVQQAEDGVTPTARFVVTAPASGVIAELGVREGAAVTPGTTMFRIAGLERVWAIAEIPEAQSMRLARGQSVKATLQADPGRSFDGRLAELLPEVDAGTRTLKARFEVANRDGALVPGMLLRLRVAGPSRSRLVTSAEAVIRTGRRTLVFVRRDDGAFEPRDVVIGQEIGDEVEIIEGLAEGERVVTSGQFLVDSEARLRSVGPVPDAAATATTTSGAPATAPGVHVADGRVESVEPDGLTISHGPVPSLKWPSMTMGFSRSDPGAFADVKKGDAIRFEFREGGPAGWQLVSVHKLAPGASR
jgi:Cu(I)/Ag(I) efflux system membrane fusion protein